MNPISTSTRHLLRAGAAVTLSSLLLVAVMSAPAAAVLIDTVVVGNAGNAADTTGFGAVGYDYFIGAKEVTNAQYVEFLNAKAADDPLGLYNPAMAGPFGGITRSGSPGSFTYSVIAGRGEKPVNYVNWYDAVRFTNWLHNGQGSGDTETGAYTLLGGTAVPTNGLSVTRNPDARWFLPSEDEWYKAAYHKNDGVTGNYFDYPTSSDTAPTAEPPPGGTNSANIASTVGNVTDAGAYVSSTSPYGTFDQGGNVWEWNETLIAGITRGARGGSFPFGASFLLSTTRFNDFPITESNSLGFRVAAAIPEPSSILLTIIGFGLFALVRKRFES